MNKTGDSSISPIQFWKNKEEATEEKKLNELQLIANKVPSPLKKDESSVQKTNSPPKGSRESTRRQDIPLLKTEKTKEKHEEFARERAQDAKNKSGFLAEKQIQSSSIKENPREELQKQIKSIQEELNEFTSSLEQRRANAPFIEKSLELDKQVQKWNPDNKIDFEETKILIEKLLGIETGCSSRAEKRTKKELADLEKKVNELQQSIPLASQSMESNPEFKDSLSQRTQDQPAFKSREKLIESPHGKISKTSEKMMPKKEVSEAMKIDWNKVTMTDDEISKLGDFIKKNLDTFKLNEIELQRLSEDAEDLTLESGVTIKGPLRQVLILYTANTPYRLINGVLDNNPHNISDFQRLTEIDDAALEEFKLEVPALAKAVAYALSKLPEHSKMTLRGAVCKEEELQNYVVGSLVSGKKFLSTSLDKENAVSFAVSKQENAKKERGEDLYAVLFQTSPCVGKNIKEFSVYRREDEILFLPDTEFEVTQVTVDKDTKRCVINLKQVGIAGNEIIEPDVDLAFQVYTFYSSNEWNHDQDYKKMLINQPELYNALTKLHNFREEFGTYNFRENFYYSSEPEGEIEETFKSCIGVVFSNKMKLAGVLRDFAKNDSTDFGKECFEFSNTLIFDGINL